MLRRFVLGALVLVYGSTDRPPEADSNIVPKAISVPKPSHAISVGYGNFVRPPLYVMWVARRDTLYLVALGLEPRSSVDSSRVLAK